MPVWIASGVFALVTLGFAGCSTAGAPPASTTVPAASTPAVSNPQPAADGDLAFTVTGTRCGVKTIGPVDLSKSATGQFCLVDVSVKNMGSEATLLESSAQQAIDAHGKRYSLAGIATVYLNDKDPSLLEQIKPGAEVKGVLPFQVADDTKITAVELHTATSTRGVLVKLP